MIENLLELLAAAGLEKLEDLRPGHIHQRVGGTVVRHYDDMYPAIPEACLLSDSSIPQNWRSTWVRANANAW